MLSTSALHVVTENPKFAALYKHITTNILNQDGTTAHDPKAEERALIQKRLEKFRLAENKKLILVDIISSLVPPPSSSSEFQDLILILPSLLSPQASHQFSPSVADIILSSPPISNIEAHLPHLIPLISSALKARATSLIRQLSPSTNPSFLHSSIPSLPVQVASLRESVESLRSDLAAALFDAIVSATNLLAIYTQAISHLIRTLEEKHGLAARSVELRAVDLSLSARMAVRSARDVLVRATREVYGPPGVMAALQNYASHLEREIERVTESARRAQVMLEEYGVGVPGSETIVNRAREAGRAKAEMLAEIECIKQDIERLQQKR